MTRKPRPGRGPLQPPGLHRATVAAGFVTGLLAGLAERGLDRDGPLAAAGIDPAVLADPRARVSLPAYAALYDAVIRAHGDEGFALFASPLRPGTFEFLCRSVVGARRLDEALDRACRFLAVVLPELRVTIRRDRDRATLVIAEAHPLRARPADPCRVFAFEWLLRLLHALACWLAGRGLAMESVRFPYPPPGHAADYALIYTERSVFGGDELEATFSPHLLDLPVRRDDEALAAFLAGGPGKITMLYRRDREAVRRVRDLLAAALPGSVTLEDAARRLGLTARTLHRRLHEEGSSFRAVKDALRRDLALTQIEKTARPIAAIAAELGYAEPSAFFRAFLAWTGEAPTAYRRRIAAREPAAARPRPRIRAS